MKRNLLLIVLMVFALSVKAQNVTVGGVMEVDSTWDADTVFVIDDIYVPDSVTLTVMPGTVVVFNDFYEIYVDGSMISIGTENEMIEYTVADTSGYSNDFSHIGWDGFSFDNTSGVMDESDSSFFIHCIFSFAQEYDDWNGGAVFRIIGFSKLLIDHCRFMHNYANGNGGAIGIQYEAEPVISNCTFIDNNAADGGGAINVGCYDTWDVYDQPVIKNCYFSKNKSWYSGSYYGGGAVKLSGYTDALVVNNLFENNTSLSQGGAIICSGYCNPWIVNNVIIGNNAGHNGGAIGIKYYAGGYFLNNTILMNESGHYGGAVSIGCDNDSVLFANNIIGVNECTDPYYDQFYIDSEDEYMKFFNNDIEGGLDTIYSEIVYIDNIDEDPMMVDPENGDFRLMCGSPCIGQALDTFTYFPALDMAGMPRLAGDGYDMGAYETQYPVVNLGSDQTISVGESTVLDAGAGFESYLWSTTETTQTVTLQGSVLGIGDHTISVTVTNDYSCEANDQVTITVEEIIDGFSSIADAGIKVFPNPNTGLFTIVAREAEITITDIHGRLVDTYISESSTVIDLSDEPKGIYLVRLNTPEYSGILKVTVQ